MSKAMVGYITGQKFSMLGDSGVEFDQFTGLGAIAELEKRLAEFYGMEHALCTSSATTALFAIALALELRSADFITSPLNFGGSLTPWLLLGNRAIFADVDPDTLTIDPNRLKADLITSRTRAVLAVDLHGYPSDTAGLRRVADDLGLWYVADAAQAFGARRNGDPASCLADAVVLSFNSQKGLAAGEGGCVLTNNADLYEQVLWWSQHPLRHKRELGVRIYNEFSFNCRIHPAAAASALRSFDLALERIADYQELCFDALARLEAADLIYPTCLSALKITPSFFSVAARPTSSVEDCMRCLVDDDIEATVTNSLSSVLYKNPVYLRQFRDRRHAASVCPVAEEGINRMTLSSLRRIRSI